MLSVRAIRAVLAVGMVATIAGLCGCSSSPALVLSADEIMASTCAPTGDAIPVEQLNDLRPVCGLSGSDLIFPDGLRFTLTAGSGSGTTYGPGNAVSPTNGWVDVGIYGTVAATTDADCSHTTWYGTKAGIAKVRKAFGLDWLCDRR